METGITAVIILVGFILALIIVVCWIALPFHVLGTNKRLDKIIALLETQLSQQSQITHSSDH